MRLIIREETGCLAPANTGTYKPFHIEPRVGNPGFWFYPTEGKGSNIVGPDRIFVTEDKCIVRPKE